MPEIFTPKKISQAKRRIKPWISSNFDRLALQQDEASVAIKSQLERWIKNVDENKRKDLLGRLTSYNNTDNISAFFELMWHQFFIEEKYELKIEPELENGRKPEFLVKTKRQNFYFEVVSIIGNEDRELRKKINITEDVLGKISLMEGFFPIAVYLKEWIGPNVKYSSFINFIKKSVGGAVLDKKIKNLSRIPYDWGNLKAEIKVFPKRKKAGRILMAVSYPGALSKVGSKRIKGIIHKKILKYRPIKDSGRPFVLAVCFDSNGLLCGQKNIEHDLFGIPIVKFPISSSRKNLQLERDSSGIFFTRNSAGEFKNTRLSAVISCVRKWEETEEYPQGFYAYEIKVFHNPFAKKPLDQNIFKKFTQFVYKGG